MLKQPDVADFVEAMIKEVDDHEQRGHWEVILRWQNPKTRKSLWPSGHSKENDFLMGDLTSTKLDFAPMGVCKPGG